MHPTARSFADRVREQFDIDVTIHEFDERTSTADEASADVTVEIVSGAERVSMEKFAEVRGISPDDVRIAPPKRVKATLGWSIGGVPPVGYEAAIPVVVDRNLLTFDKIWGGAGTPTAMASFNPEEVVESNDVTIADIAES